LLLHYDFRKIQKVGPQNAYLLSNKGLFYTNNGGTIWSTVKSAPPGIISFFFLNEQEGWLVGHKGTIHHTDNGGRTWKSTTISNNHKAYRTIFFINRKHGWVAGDNGKIWRTLDGGNTWYHQNSGTTHNINDLYWKNSRQCILATEDKIFLSNDSGMNWYTIQTHHNNKNVNYDILPDVYTFDILSDGTIFLAGSHGLVMKSVDGGMQWKNLRSHVEFVREQVSKRWSIDYAQRGYHLGFGFVYPVGKIGKRFGPGITIGGEYWSRKSRFKIGIGSIFHYMVGDEKIYATSDEEAEPVLMTGQMIHVPLMFQYTIWEHRPWAIRGQMGGGFVWHYLEISSSNETELPSYIHISRDRIGFGLIQAFTIGCYSSGAVNNSLKHIGRVGVHLRFALEETRTWPVGTQSDLGIKDPAKFGLELFPMVSLELGHFF
jgi:hypothetical protein